MDGKKHEQKKDAAGGKNSFGQFALIFIAVFASAYFFFAYWNAQNDFNVSGISFKTGGAAPADALKAALGAKKEVVLKAELTGNFTCAYEMLAQAALGLGASNKSVSIGASGDSACVNRNNTGIPCTSADVEITRGDCNCVKVEGNAVKIIGSDSFLCENAGKMGQIFIATLGGTQVTRETAQQILGAYKPQASANASNATN